MTFKCSECKGEVIQLNDKLVCQKCGRIKEFNNKESNTIKEIDMNDKTKNFDGVLYG